MSKFLPFKTKVSIKSDIFIKTYTNIPQYYSDRILKCSKLMSELDIGPKVLSSVQEADKLVIVFNKIRPAVKSDFQKEFKQELIEIIHMLHEYDYVHGDLCISNIGVNHGRPILLDFDTMFNISQADLKCNMEYMKTAFDVDNINDFIKYDYDNWQIELEED